MFAQKFVHKLIYDIIICPICHKIKAEEQLQWIYLYMIIIIYIYNIHVIPVSFHVVQKRKHIYKIIHTCYTSQLPCYKEKDYMYIYVQKRKHMYKIIHTYMLHLLYCVFK